MTDTPGHRRRRSGAYSVEFALLLPVYVMLVFGIVDFGWVMYHLASLHAAAHSGCRTASLRDPGLNELNMATVTEEARTRMQDHFEETGPGCPDSGCATSASAVGARPSRSLECRIQVEVDPLAGLNVAPITLGATAIVRLEHQRGG